MFDPNYDAGTGYDPNYQYQPYDPTIVRNPYPNPNPTNQPVNQPFGSGPDQGPGGISGRPQTGVTDAGSPSSSTMPAGIDPRLAALYQQYGVTPGGPGSGFTDWQYWQNVLNTTAKGDWGYISNRLGSDLAGTGPDAPAGSPQGGGGIVPGGSGPGLGQFTPNIPTSVWSPDPRTNDLYNTLLGRSQQSLRINRNDPIIRNQTDAFNAADTRQQRDYLNNLAERGGGTENLNMERRMSSEKVGQDTAQFQAQLMGQELTARREEIQNALTQMGGLLTEQERLQLQNQLAIMDNLLGQAGLQQGAYQFDQQMQFNNSPMGF